jgi:3-phosphoshikimate 1-carboxyvinyltransferase|tara:strand:+ start:523 stop:1824 length:1302 start_codon:yes stop_codon:yes gene_type:complete
MTSNLIINGSEKFNVEIIVPGDKSITHRALMIAALSNGICKISNYLQSDDCINTISILKNLGVSIDMHEDNSLTINAKGLKSLKKPKKDLEAGNSGTLIRLLSGILSMQDFTSIITGDTSLQSRPMARIIEPLTKMGAVIQSRENKPPLEFSKPVERRCCNEEILIASAQVKSCLILASLFVEGESIIIENIKTRDHTERLLQYFNYDIKIDDNRIKLYGKKDIFAKDIEVPNDFSSASFFIVAALLKKGSQVLIKDVCVNEYRIGLTNILKKMGGQIEFKNLRTNCNEDIADISVSYSKLKAINISGEIISSLIDELPILFIACACASGKSVISDIEELRYKESDRILSMEKGLRELGIDVLSTESSISIIGGQINGGIVDSFDDHRVAMSFAISGIISSKPITILKTKNISTSFPNFVDTLRQINVEVYEI